MSIKIIDSNSIPIPDSTSPQDTNNTNTANKEMEVLIGKLSDLGALTIQPTGKLSQYVQIHKTNKYAEIKIGDTDKDVVYVKVNELSKILGISEKLIKKAVSEKGDADNLLESYCRLKSQGHQDAVIQKVGELVKSSGNFRLYNAVSKISFKAETLPTMLADKRFKTTKMHKTLIKASKVRNQKLKNTQEKDKTNIVEKTKSHYGFIIDNDNKIYITENVIGKGAFKEVSAGIAMEDIVDIVVGVIKTTSVGGATDIQNEKDFLDKYDGQEGFPPNYIFTFKSENTGTTVHGFMQKRMKGDGKLLFKMDTKSQVKAMSGALRGLANMHAGGDAMMDFKIPNILIDDAGNGYITDFGLAGKIGNPPAGYTPIYAAPEVATAHTATDKMDSFAAGVSLLQLACPDQFITYYPTLCKIVSFFVGLYYKTKIDLNGVPLLLKPLARPLNTLKTDEYNKFMDSAEKHLKNSWWLKKKDRQLRLEMFKISRGLLHPDPIKRMACKDAADQLDLLKTPDKIS